MKELSKEDKERIEDESQTFSRMLPNGCINSDIIIAAFKDGAGYEHLIAFKKGKIEGFNEGIEAAKTTIIKTVKDKFGQILSAQTLIVLEELEKLKKL